MLMLNEKEYTNIIDISNKYNYKNFKKQKLVIKKYIFLLIVSILLILLLIIEIIKLKMKIKHIKENKFFKQEINKLKKNLSLKYKNNKYLFQLYIENRTQFYIQGRKYLMKSLGRDYNDSKIITFQDKLNWLLVHDSPENKSEIVDKILLRNYSKKILGKDICVPLIKIYKDVNEINLDDLPNSFVLKCNHGSSMNIICSNKSTFNLTEAKKKLNKWMKINYGLIGYEYQYLNIKRKIFAEKFLKDNLTDYKFYCFNGIPKLIKVQSKYFIDNIKMYHYYDLNWKITDIETKLDGNIKLPQIKFSKPKYLDLMIKYAKQFSKNFIFVRVDLYEFNDTVYLSELTFTPANARSPYRDEKQRIYLGNLLNLNNVNNRNKNNKYKN